MPSIDLVLGAVKEQFKKQPQTETLHPVRDSNSRSRVTAAEAIARIRNSRQSTARTKVCHEDTARNKICLSKFSGSSAQKAQRWPEVTGYCHLVSGSKRYFVNHCAVKRLNEPEWCHSFIAGKRVEFAKALDPKGFWAARVTRPKKTPRPQDLLRIQVKTQDFERGFPIWWVVPAANVCPCPPLLI